MPDLLTHKALFFVWPCLAPHPHPTTFEWKCKSSLCVESTFDYWQLIHNPFTTFIMAKRNSSITYSICRLSLVAFCAYLVTSSTTYAFVPCNPTTHVTSTALNIFGGLKNAFANDDSLGKAKNEGLTSGPRYNDKVSVNGKPVANVVVNQKISQVCNAARVKVPYNCQNGECGTCTVKMNGRKIRACVSVVPQGKCEIQT